jgi:hypothetical protein
MKYQQIIWKKRNNHTIRIHLKSHRHRRVRLALVEILNHWLIHEKHLPYLTQPFRSLRLGQWRHYCRIKDCLTKEFEQYLFGHTEIMLR